MWGGGGVGGGNSTGTFFTCGTLNFILGIVFSWKRGKHVAPAHLLPRPNTTKLRHMTHLQCLPNYTCAKAKKIEQGQRHMWLVSTSDLFKPKFQLLIENSFRSTRTTPRGYLTFINHYLRRISSDYLRKCFAKMRW